MRTILSGKSTRSARDYLTVLVRERQTDMARTAAPEGYTNKRVTFSDSALENLETLSALAGIQSDAIVTMVFENMPDSINEMLAVHLEEKAKAFRNGALNS